MEGAEMINNFIKDHPWLFFIVGMLCVSGSIWYGLTLRESESESEKAIEEIDLANGGYEKNEYTKAYTYYINDPYYPLATDGGPKPAEYARGYLDRAKRNTFGKPKRVPASP
jgi:hypothetical protein